MYTYEMTYICMYNLILCSFSFNTKPTFPFFECCPQASVVCQCAIHRAQSCCLARARSSAWHRDGPSMRAIIAISIITRSYLIISFL